VLQKKIYIPTIPHKIFEANLKSPYPSVSVVVVEALIVNANTSSTTLTTLSGGRGLLMLMV